MKLEIKAVLSEKDASKEAEYVISTPGSVDSRDDVQKLCDAVIGVVELQDVVERLCDELQAELHPGGTPEELAQIQQEEQAKQEEKK